MCLLSNLKFKGVLVVVLEKNDHIWGSTLILKDAAFVHIYFALLNLLEPEQLLDSQNKVCDAHTLFSKLCIIY